MELWFSLVSVFVAGLMGAGHCMGMCGGIVGALSMAAGGARERWQMLAFYNIGRIGSYTLLGAIAGFLGFQFEQIVGPWLRIVAGVLLVLMGFYIANWWRALVWLERLGSKFWRLVQPFSKRFLPITSRWQALPLGMIWGLLPCGLVYTALAFAASQGSALNGALTMTAFGLGTMPAIVISGVFAIKLQQFLARRILRTLMALLLIGFGVWTASFGFLHGAHNAHSTHNAQAPDSDTEIHQHSHH